ncbi:MAG: ABC transporter permease [Flavobacteriaceae bacterium]|nr:ABC transporter permease [Flavobacteriaceae bacterium]
MNKDQDWLFEIKPKSNLFMLNFKEIWQYRDLLMLFVKRDVVTLYKQTILGPLWYIIQPLLTSLIFTLIFNNIANISTGSVPPFLFNLTGVIIWTYFKECFVSTSDTFKKNEAIFGKVYFPRVIMPLSIVVSNLLKFFIQLIIFIGFYVYFIFKGHDLSPNKFIFLYPFLVFLMGLLGLGLGMIISSLVTKYRDLTFLVNFGVQLLMYLSAVMYPLTLIQDKLPQKFSWLVTYNPLAQIIELSRNILINTVQINFKGLGYSSIITVIIVLFGLLIFNKTEKSFIDTI